MKERSERGEALTELILEVFRLNGRLLAAGDRMAQPFGQTSARWQVLGALDGAPQTVSGIARSMGQTRQSVQRIADILADAGLVEFRENPAHRRAKLVQLTPRGRAVLDAITERQVDWVNELGERFGKEEIQHALRLVQRLRRELEHQAPRESGPRERAGDHNA